MGDADIGLLEELLGLPDFFARGRAPTAAGPPASLRVRSHVAGMGCGSSKRKSKQEESYVAKTRAREGKQSKAETIIVCYR